MTLSGRLTSHCTRRSAHARRALAGPGADERVFEVTMSIYPASRFRYSVELKLEYSNGRAR